MFVNAYSYQFISVILVFGGAVLLLLSIAKGIAIKTRVSKDLSKKWLIIILFMVFFFLGYSFFIYGLVAKIRFPLAFVTGSIFFGGACFVYIVVKLTDVTIHRLKVEINKRRKLEVRIIRAKKEWEETFDIIEDAITIHDSDFNVIRANKAAIKMFGLPFRKVIGHKCFEMYHGTDHPPSNCPSCAALKEGDSCFSEFFEPNLDKFIEIRAIPRFDKNDNTPGIIGIVHVMRDITHRKHIEERLRTLAITDDLTGLYNRRGFFAMAGQQLKIAKRMNREILLLSADLDHLKGINDKFGHKEGDEALIEAATILKETFRESDIIARIGGDEFAVVQMEDSTIDTETVSERLQNNIEKYNAGKNRGYDLSLSFGIAHYAPDSYDSVDEILNQADKLMYENKKLRQKF
jgi:diguanylate cyclase (GGDEF)-like protein/PAS domain S-box-containing protein